jgi:hypothetical protein
MTYEKNAIEIIDYRLSGSQHIELIVYYTPHKTSS